MWAPSHSLPDNLRHVGSLHLRVADADGAGRARIAIEDGLACADFGDCGRLIYVRRLALPAFAGQFNGPAAARAIEATFRALLPDAVHGAEPRAASAPMVWFADVLDARLAALSHRVEGEALTAWFWRHVDRSIARDTEPAIAVLFAAIEAMNEGAITPAVAMKALARQWRNWSAAAFERFLVALPVCESPAGLPLAPPPISGPPAPIYKSATPARALAAGVAARLGLAARVAPARVAWIARWELIAADIMPADAPQVHQAMHLRELLDQVFEPIARENGRPPDASVAVTHALRAPEVAMPREVVQAAVAREAERRDALPGESRESTRPLLALPPWLAGAQLSSCAGFFMLLNAWRAVGVDDCLMAGGAARGDAWLERWARGFGLPADDVQRLAWQPPSAPLRDTDENELGLRRRAARRWLRTVARVGPASVVMRPGAISITRTHIDVILPLNNVDLRIRRAGLDQDPGWVSWLGRIVAFHYVEAGNAS